MKSTSDGIKATDNSIITNEDFHVQNNIMHSLNESVQNLSVQLYAVKESLVYMEQHYARTLDALNGSMKNIQVTTEALGSHLQSIETMIESYHRDVVSCNGTELLHEISSLRNFQQQTHKDLYAMEELMRLLVLNHLIDEVPAKLNGIEKDAKQDTKNVKEEKNELLDKVTSFLKAGDLDQAEKLYRKMACNVKIDDIRFWAYKHFQDGKYSEAKFWAERGAEQVDVESMLILGLLYDRGLGVEKNESIAARWFEKSAVAGNSTSMNNIAYDYQKGIGVAVNYQKAIYWYKKAIDAENIVAMFNLANMYRTGEGVEKSVMQAVELYRLAAKKGDSDAMDVLGDIYRYGDGISQNYKKAVEWYIKAAEEGHSGAMTSLGYMYHSGEGVTLNYDEAIKWYKLAIQSDKMNGTALFNLGYMYENGEGVKRDEVRARDLYRKAYMAGEDDAKECLKHMGVTNRELLVIKVRSIISGLLSLEYDEVKKSDTLLDDLGADSLDIVEIIMALEEEFGIEITDEEAEKVKNVADVVNLIYYSG